MLSVKIVPYVHKLTNDTALLWFAVDCTSKQEKFGGWTAYDRVKEFFNTQQLSIKHLLEISDASHFNWPLWILIAAGFGLTLFYNIYNIFIDYND